MRIPAGLYRQVGIDRAQRKTVFHSSEISFSAFRLF